MTNLEIKQIVGDTPHMNLEQANKMTDFIEQNNIKNILELGFAHGVSTTYMAAALKRINNDGRITTIDTVNAKKRNPNIKTFLEAIGEHERVKTYYEPTSYTWRLMKLIEENPTPKYDFCYLDGAHNWYVDGFAFFLVDKLLEPNGWIIFDDIHWTYESSPTMKNSDYVRNMPEDERTTPQVKKIFDLLVKTHPNYHNFKIENGWGYAQKKSS